MSKVLPALLRHLCLAAVGKSNFLGRHRTPRPQVIQGGVAGKPHDPSGEGDLARVVLVDRLHQLGEDVLGYVFRLVMVLDQTVDEALNVGCVANVEEMQALAVAGLGPLDRLLYEAAVPRARGAGLGEAREVFWAQL